MKSKFYAQDTSFFHSLGSYDFDTRCEMLKELGYDGTYLCLWTKTAWRDLTSLGRIKKQYDLEVVGVFARIDVLAGEEDPGNAAVVRLLETLEGANRFELALEAGRMGAGLSDGDPAAESQAVRWLEKLVTIAERRNLLLSLYPHAGGWLSKTEHGIALCQKINNPALRLVFSGYHWFAQGGQNLRAILQHAAPYLSSVSTCGSRRNEHITKFGFPVAPGAYAQLPATIEPLDQGDLDNFALMAALRQVGYSGPIGLLGYAVGGDVYANLRRSIVAFRDIEKRLDAHPSWGNLREERSPMTHFCVP
jgi:sugar phosphate isomerase/epimerase